MSISYIEIIRLYYFVQNNKRIHRQNLQILLLFSIFRIQTTIALFKDISTLIQIHTFWCGIWDLNPYASRHRNLNPACLPIPSIPLRLYYQICSSIVTPYERFVNQKSIIPACNHLRNYPYVS